MLKKVLAAMTAAHPVASRQSNLKHVNEPEAPIGVAGGSLHTRSVSVLLSWTERFAETFEREVHALQFDQQEREFLATSHGRTYKSGERPAALLRGSKD